MIRHLAILLVAALAACAHAPELQTRVQTVEVRVPVHAPCPAEADVPALPARVAAEHPALPTDPNEQARILGAKIIELFTYAERADGILRACARSAPANP